ncbi:MAG: flagellar basal body rod protein FlgB [Anaerolineales bacterium]|nr:flagellar basal body rod protein FlgB [Anaerolineales bacterium]
MAESLFSDVGFRTAQAALDGLALRQDLIGRNLANVDTPGYHAQAVTFEETLQRVSEPSNKLALSVTQAGHQLGHSSEPVNLLGVTERPGGSERADGNNVDVDQELTEMAETGLRYQALSQLVSRKLLLLKSIATGR